MFFKLRNIISVSLVVLVLLMMSYCGNDTSTQTKTEHVAPKGYLNHGDSAQ
jgi:hypothetical protein